MSQRVHGLSKAYPSLNTKENHLNEHQLRQEIGWKETRAGNVVQHHEWMAMELACQGPQHWSTLSEDAWQPLVCSLLLLLHTDDEIKIPMLRQLKENVNIKMFLYPPAIPLLFTV